MPTDIKLSKAELSKIIQSGGFLSALLRKLADLLMKIGVPLAKILLTSLTTMASASTIGGSIQRKMRGKGINLASSNEDMDDTIRIIKLLNKSSVWMHGVGETVKHEIKKQEGRFLGMLLRTLGASMLGKYVNWKRCCKSWKKSNDSRKKIK